MEFIEVINKMAASTPAGHQIILTIESGYAGFHAVTTNGEIDNLPSADKDLEEQANDMLCVVNGWIGPTESAITRRKLSVSNPRTASADTRTGIQVRQGYRRRW